MRAATPALVALVGLAGVMLAVGLPPAPGAVLGAGPGVPVGLWELWYTAHHLLSDGLHTTLLEYPDGGRIWPGPVLEGLLLAPVTLVAGPALAWNLLAMLRVLAAGLGTALLLRRWSLSPWLALLVACSPPLLQALAAGEGIDPGVAWAPLAVFLLGTPGWLAALGAALLLGTAPTTWLAACAMALVLSPEVLGRREGLVVMGLGAVPWLVQLSTRGAGTSLLGVGGTSGPTLDPDRHGDLLGALGLGDARAWGGVVLLLSLVALRRSASPRSRRALGLVILGAFVALGPAVVLAGQGVEVWDRTVPLPLSLVDGLPPLGLVDDLACMGIVSWLGLAIILGELRRPWALVALLGLLQGTVPTWTTPPAPWPAQATGPTLLYPLEQEPWSMVAQTVHGQPISHGPRGAVAGLEELISARAWTPAELQAWAEGAGFETLDIHPDAVWGQALEVAGLLGSHQVSVAGDRWPGIILREHAFDNARPIGPLPAEVPKAPAAWTWVDPVLEPLLDPDLLGVALTRIRIYGSTDGGQTWALRDSPVVHSLTTLGVTVVRNSFGDDVAIVVSGLSDFDQVTGYEFRGTHPATVLALTSPDLKGWGLRRYELNQAVAVVDPHLEWWRGELSLFAWTTDRLGVDPMLLQGDHTVVRASIGRSGRFEVVDTLLSRPRLADPTPMGDALLYTSIDFGETIEERVAIAVPGPDGQLVDAAEFAGVSVPFAWRDGEEWRLLAHGFAPTEDGSKGPQAVVEARSSDGLEWSDFQPVVGLRAAPCESPVATVFRGEYLLICSERVR